MTVETITGGFNAVPGSLKDLSCAFRAGKGRSSLCYLREWLHLPVSGDLTEEVDGGIIFI